jgi:elongator complex protein 6
VIVTMAADSPLVREQETPLETNHAALVLHTAHQADFIMSLRLLDSGTARDVSGIIRITQGESDMANENMAENIEERELLYFVGGDGSVKVFERGQ